ncbi:hypothetical protein FHG87_002955 [Trinorchestia longiramus]|nr:hypothetical protein FHG87_002955 [Trinorchestia longiramus]
MLREGRHIIIHPENVRDVASESTSCCRYYEEDRWSTDDGRLTGERKVSLPPYIIPGAMPVRSHDVAGGHLDSQVNRHIDHKETLVDSQKVAMLDSPSPSFNSSVFNLMVSVQARAAHYRPHAVSHSTCSPFALVTVIFGSSMMDCETAPASTTRLVPRVPAAAERAKGASGLLNYWRSCVRDAAKLGRTEGEDSANSTVIRMVVTPKTQLLANIAPQGSSKHPLYLGTSESRSLKVNLVLDSLSEHDFSPALLQPNAELTVLNLNKKNLEMKTDSQGKLTVNGVPGEVVDVTAEGLTVIALDDFIFDHRQCIQQIRTAASSN